MLPIHANRAKAASKELLNSQTNDLKPPIKKKANANVVLFAIVGYMACSSLMLIGNKIAVYNIPAPSFILWSQMLSCGMLFNYID